MVGKVSCSYVGEHSQRPGHLEESRVDMTRLSSAMLGAGRGMERGGPSEAARRLKVQRGKVAKMVGLSGLESSG